MGKTIEQKINDLRKDWLEDPVWDIEETEGFEEHNNEYPKEKCRTCFHAVRMGCGTKLIGGRRVHFDLYGCKLEKMQV